MSVYEFLWQEVRRVLFFTFLTLTLHAETLSYKVIFGVDKNETIVTKNLTFTKKLFETQREAQVLQKRNHLNFHRVSYGDYKAIEFSPIEKLDTQQALTLFLKPYFPDLFVINRDHAPRKVTKVYQPIVVDYTPQETTVALEIEKRLENKNWFKQWHLLIVILLLGGFFFYRKFNKLKIMKEQQRVLSKEQDSIETKLQQ